MSTSAFEQGWEVSCKDLHRRILQPEMLCYELVANCTQSRAHASDFGEVFNNWSRALHNFIRYEMYL